MNELQNVLQQNFKDEERKQLSNSEPQNSEETLKKLYERP